MSSPLHASAGTVYHKLLPALATRDVGNYAAQRLLDLDFSGKQTRELLGKPLLIS